MKTIFAGKIKLRRGNLLCLKIWVQRRRESHQTAVPELKALAQTLAENQKKEATP